MINNSQKNLHDIIAACKCITCRALTALKDEAGAKINISPKRNGRMCEVAVVAASGARGLTGNEVVTRRGAYASHLGLELVSGTQNRPIPMHIAYAVNHSNHAKSGRSGSNPFNLGRAKATFDGERYRLLWDPAPSSGLIDGPLTVPLNTFDVSRSIEKRGIEIRWSEGVERIELDLENLSLQTVVTNTFQDINTPLAGYPAQYVYHTTSSVVSAPGGAFQIAISYSHKNNKHINENDSWWGTTTIVLRSDIVQGKVEWTPEGTAHGYIEHDFHAVSWLERDEAEDDTGGKEEEEERARLADEAAIRGNANLSETEKVQLIMARRGQGRFRAAVLRQEPSCRVTGTMDPDHLRASHIKAWAKCDTNDDRLDANNGLMLAPHIDHLFDKAYISFEDDGTLIVLQDPAVEILLKEWAIDKATLAPRPFNARQQTFLAVHRQRLHERHEARIAPTE